LAHNILPIAYCPIARGANSRANDSIFETEIIKKISEKHAKAPAQVVLNWGISRTCAVIPRSSNTER